MLNMQTGDLNLPAGDTEGIAERSTNFSVLRLRRDILRRSNVGVMYTGRSDSLYGTGSNQAYGVDGLFSFYQNVNINAYWAETRTPGAGFGGDESSYRGQLDYTGDRYGVRLERLAVGRDFNPEIGFLRRRDFEESLAMFRFSPRPRSITSIRQFFFEGQIDYITNRAGVVETRQGRGRFGMELESGDLFDVVYNRNYEYFSQPFPVAGIFYVPAGAYDFEDVEVGYSLGAAEPARRPTSGSSAAASSAGTKTSVNFGMGQSFFGSRLEISPQLSFEPTVSFNRIDIPAIGPAFTTGLISTRAIYAFNPLMFFSGLVQYNSAADAVSTNLRLRWEYSPGRRAVRGLQRGTLRHDAPAAAVPAAPEPRVHREAQPALPLLTAGSGAARQRWLGRPPPASPAAGRRRRGAAFLVQLALLACGRSGETGRRAGLKIQ